MRICKSGHLEIQELLTSFFCLLAFDEPYYSIFYFNSMTLNSRVQEQKFFLKNLRFLRNIYQVNNRLIYVKKRPNLKLEEEILSYQ